MSSKLRKSPTVRLCVLGDGSAGLRRQSRRPRPAGLCWFRALRSWAPGAWPPRWPPGVLEPHASDACGAPSASGPWRWPRCRAPALGAREAWAARGRAAAVARRGSAAAARPSARPFEPRCAGARRQWGFRQAAHLRPSRLGGCTCRPARRRRGAPPVACGAVRVVDLLASLPLAGALLRARVCALAGAAQPARHARRRRCLRPRGLPTRQLLGPPLRWPERPRPPRAAVRRCQTPAEPCRAAPGRSARPRGLPSLPAARRAGPGRAERNRGAHPWIAPAGRSGPWQPNGCGCKRRAAGGARAPSRSAETARAPLCRAWSCCPCSRAVRLPRYRRVLSKCVSGRRERRVGSRQGRLLLLARAAG